MTAFLLRRLAGLAGVLLCAVTLTFLFIRLTPGGPFSAERKLAPQIEEQLRLRYQLEGPEGRAAAERLADRFNLGPETRQRFGDIGSGLQQYFDYLGDLLRGDLRISTKYRDRSVNELLADALR